MLTPGQLWRLLGDVRCLAFVAASEAATGWNGCGVGTVVVSGAGDGGMTFHEAGTWRPDAGGEIRFRNVYRWTVLGDRVRLEHLRFGADHPVYLFDLVPGDDGAWRSDSAHVCGEDCYSAGLWVEDGEVVLRWAIDGPRKRERIEYRYSADLGHLTETAVPPGP